MGKIYQSINRGRKDEIAIKEKFLFNNVDIQVKSLQNIHILVQKYIRGEKFTNSKLNLNGYCYYYNIIVNSKLQPGIAEQNIECQKYENYTAEFLKAIFALFNKELVDVKIF